MESAAFKKLTEQLTEIVQYVRLAKMAFLDNLTGKGLKPMLTNDDAAKMLGVSKRTLQRMRSENRIDFIKIGNQWIEMEIAKNREEYGLIKTDLSKQKIEDKKS